MKKLNRNQIKEALDQMPIEKIILGHNQTGVTLTAKQKAFAEEIAKGNTKAGAYRKAYNSKAKPKTQSQNGQNLLKNKAIQTQIESIKLALEAQKYLAPLHLRALTIHKLTEKALDDRVPPAQQLKALELLGKITEVALFTDRKEVVTVSSSDQIKEKLLSRIKLAMQSSNATDIEASAEDLLAEISGSPASALASDDGEVLEILPDQTPPDTIPPKALKLEAAPLHSNPHPHTPPNSESTPLPKGGSIDDTGDKNVTVAGGTVTNAEESTTCVSSSGIPTPSENVGDGEDDENIGYTPL